MSDAALRELERDRDYWKQHALEENAKWLAYEGVDAVLDKFGVAKTFRMDDEDVSLKPYQRIQELGMRAVKAEKQSALAPATATDVSVIEEVRAALEVYARFDFYIFLFDPIGQQTDPTKRAREALAKLDAGANTKQQPTNKDQEQ